MSLNILFEQNQIDCDIIPATPQKKKSRATTKTVSPHHLNDYEVETANIDVKHENTTVINHRYKRPYIFFEITEICNFTKFYQPSNFNIKSIGIYRRNHLLDHRCIFMKLQIYVKLDLTRVTVPQYNETIEVYGYVLIPEKIFVVNFWMNINKDHIHRYWRNLKRQKLYFTPQCYKEVKLEKGDISTFDGYYFEEIDESNLIRNVEYAEEIDREIQNIMNIDEKIFV